MSFTLLFLCTGNQCRSPLAAELTRRRLARRDVIVRSAGLLPGGRPVPAEGIRIASDYHLDLTGHVSRRFDEELAADSDLVLAMTNAQAREIVTSHADVWPRVFTLKPFVRWLSAQSVPREGLSRGWLNEVAAARSPHELLGSSAADEVEDPLGRSLRTWRRVAVELSQAVDLLVPALPTRSTIPSR